MNFLVQLRVSRKNYKSNNPNLKEIDISHCHNLNQLSTLIEECFEEQKYEQSFKRILIRRSYTQI